MWVFGLIDVVVGIFTIIAVLDQTEWLPFGSTASMVLVGWCIGSTIMRGFNQITSND